MHRHFASIPLPFGVHPPKQYRCSGTIRVNHITGEQFACFTDPTSGIEARPKQGNIAGGLVVQKSLEMLV